MSIRRTRAAGLAVAAVLVVLLAGCSASSPTPPEVTRLSTAEVEAQAALDLENNRVHWLGAFPDVEVPEVERVRFIDWQEWPAVMASCLTDAGFPTESAQGGLPTAPPGGQESAWALAAYTCSAQYPVDPQQTVALNDDQLRYLYEYYTQVAMPCMRGLGFHDFSATPSVQTFMDDYGTERGWSPFTDVADGASDELWQSIERECPQVPDRLYG